MRMLIHLWMVLTLVLGICGDDMVRREAEDGITYEGSGMNMGSGGLPITGHIDDEDYSSSFVESISSYDGSGSSYDSSESYNPIEDNSIRMRGEFVIEGISQGNLDWMPALENVNSQKYHDFANLIAPLIQNALEAKKNTRNGLISVTITGFRHGSIITEYEAIYTPESTVTEEQIRKSIKEAVANNKFGGLTVDPKSVSGVTAIRPAGIVITETPVTKAPKPVTPQKPAKATTSNVIATTTVTSSVTDVERGPTREKNKTEPPPTTKSNAINDKTDPPKREPTNNNNEVGGVIDIDATPQQVEEDLDNEIGDKDNQKKDNTEQESKSFWEIIFSHPATLAGLVGAVVLALLTVVLLLMFIVYRIKKKDEGSYSLDEPHKVKDPMAYWKDTKEFYA